MKHFRNSVKTLGKCELETLGRVKVGIRYHLSRSNKTVVCYDNDNVPYRERYKYEKLNFEKVHRSSLENSRGVEVSRNPLQQF